MGYAEGRAQSRAAVDGTLDQLLMAGSLSGRHRRAEIVGVGVALAEGNAQLVLFPLNAGQPLLPLIRQERGMGQGPVVKADVEGVKARRKGQLHHILHGHNTLVRPLKYDIGGCG